MQTNSNGRFIRSSGGSFWGKRKTEEPAAIVEAKETTAHDAATEDAATPTEDKPTREEVAVHAKHFASSASVAADELDDEHRAAGKHARPDVAEAEIVESAEEEPVPAAIDDAASTEELQSSLDKDSDEDADEEEPISEEPAEKENPLPEEPEDEVDLEHDEESETAVEAQPENGDVAPEGDAFNALDVDEPEEGAEGSSEDEELEVPDDLEDYDEVDVKREATPKPKPKPIAKSAAKASPQRRKPTPRAVKPSNATPSKSPEAKQKEANAKPAPSAKSAFKSFTAKFTAPKKKKKKKAKKAKRPPKLPKFLENSPAAQKLLALWINHRAATIAVTATVLVIVVTYVGGGVFFSTHFLPHTTVNGNDVSLLTKSAFAQRSAHEAQNYTATITGDGVNLTIAGADANLVMDTNVYVDAAASQVPAWTWPIAIFSEQQYTVDSGVSLDESKVQQLLSAQISKVNQDPTPTSNATIAYDPDTSDFVAVKEKLGTEIDADAALAKVSTNMKGLNATIDLGDDELVQPKITVNDEKFKKALSSARSFPDLKIPLTLAGDTTVTLDPDQVRSWLVVGSDSEITGDLDAINYYTLNTLSPKLDSVSGYRTYTRPDGKTIQINDGTYGWSIDSGELAKVIASRIESQSDKPIEIPCKSKAAVYNPGGADWGNRYIDVDITEQYARMYDDGGNLIWESECVSGGPAEANDTVTGVFYIEDKVSPMKLIGLDSNGDGEPDYENDVTYWMPFWGGYGFHDATWRYSFGGSEYLYDGSHGCVNLPYAAAELLYYNVEVGDPVVVHT